MSTARRSVLAAVVLFAAPAGAAANHFSSGNELLRLCKGQASAGEAGISACGAFVVGAAQGLNVGHDIGRLQSKTSGDARLPKDVAASRLLCFPKNASPAQLSAPVVAFLEGNPDKRHLEAIALVQAALVRAFPCQAFQAVPQPSKAPKPRP